MGTKDFAEFVQSQQDATADTAMDWDRIRDEWLQHLDNLHTQITVFLDEYIEAGSISYSYREIQLTEGDLGTYSAKVMDIKIGRQSVHLQPIGTMLIGCDGRVDVIGSGGSARIILVDEKAGSARDLFRVTVTLSTEKPTSSRPLVPQAKPRFIGLEDRFKGSRDEICRA